jgi:hypothetical protein
MYYNRRILKKKQCSNIDIRFFFIKEVNMFIFYFFYFFKLVICLEAFFHVC